jgi:hypothetical protein
MYLIGVIGGYVLSIIFYLIFLGAVRLLSPESWILSEVSWSSLGYLAYYYFLNVLLVLAINDSDRIS